MVDNPVPQKINSLINVIAVSGDSGFSLVLQENGTLWAFGENVVGSLGNGTNVDSSIPVQVEW